MAKIYGTPIMAGGAGGMNRDLPPLLDNFKAFEGGGIDDGLTRLKDLPNGTKVKFGTYNSQTLVWRIAQDEGVTKAVLDLNYDTGKTVIGDMVPSSGSIAGNWGIVGWLNATEAGGSWWANRVKYSDDPPETEPDYSSQDGFLHGWSETDRGLLQSIDWDCNDMGDFEPYKLNSKLIIVANNEGLLAWNGEGFCASLGDSPVVTRTYHDPSAAYGGISGMGTSITEGTAYPNESIGIWPVCAPNPEAIVSDEPDDDGCYTIDYNKIAVTIQADKMEESRANELAGAVWVYGDHIPKNVNDGTKIQLTREEITRPDGEPYITLNDVPASDAEIETIINIKESDGELHPYLYLSNDYLGSGAGLLLRKDCYQKGVWHNTGTIGVFNGSQFDVWCSNTFPTLLDTSISNILMEVDLPTKTTGAIRRKCFTLSYTEYGGDMYPAEGTALSYFKDNVRRQSMFNGGTVDYWTRSKYDVSQAYFIGLTGGLGHNTNTLSLGYRPAFCLPLTFKLKATPNENGSYDMYDEVSDISTFASSEFIVEKSVSWEQTKNFYARQFTYNSKKQYQTMLEGAIAKIYSGQSIAELPSGSKVKLGTWKNTPLQWKVARDTSDQSLRLVLEPTSVSLLGTMAYDAAEPSNSDSNRRSYGNNRYIYSNIHQWLNATKVSGWYTAQHSADAAPAYASSPGFLSGWSENHIATLDRATLTTSRASIDGGGTETFVARVALISTTELGLQSGTGGGRLDIFNSDGDRSTGAIYWTRTPDSSGSSYAYRVRSAGDLGFHYVYYAVGFRPLCIPKSTTYVSLQPDSDGCYTITGVNE